MPEATIPPFFPRYFLRMDGADHYLEEDLLIFPSELLSDMSSWRWKKDTFERFGWQEHQAAKLKIFCHNGLDTTRCGSAKQPNTKPHNRIRHDCGCHDRNQPPCYEHQAGTGNRDRKLFQIRYRLRTKQQLAHLSHGIRLSASAEAETAQRPDRQKSEQTESDRIEPQRPNPVVKVSLALFDQIG